MLTGIGLEVHESPYLRGGSDDIILSGHAFSNEPGIYIEGKVRSKHTVFQYLELKLIYLCLRLGYAWRTAFISMRTVTRSTSPRVSGDKPPVPGARSTETTKTCFDVL